MGYSERGDISLALEIPVRDRLATGLDGWGRPGVVKGESANIIMGDEDITGSAAPSRGTQNVSFSE